ncbi:MAG: NTP transferase domain-containing protein [Gemmatimonadetes bacterium]|nr:NTP transferase domain-containing protein [Gemmatimonadota bacterium]
MDGFAVSESLLGTRQTVILAAGNGSRLSASRGNLPKPLVRVAGQALIEHALDQAAAAGVEEAIIVTGNAADQMRAHLETVEVPAQADRGLQRPLSRAQRGVAARRRAVRRRAVLPADGRPRLCPAGAPLPRPRHGGPRRVRPAAGGLPPGEPGRGRRHQGLHRGRAHHRHRQGCLPVSRGGYRLLPARPAGVPGAARGGPS